VRISATFSFEGTNSILISHKLTFPMISNMNMLHSSVVFRVLGDSNGRLVVNSESNRRLKRSTKFREE
jgi:hypothetical protein